MEKISLFINDRIRNMISLKEIWKKKTQNDPN